MTGADDVQGHPAWVDGRLVPLADASVHVLDPGFRTGEGVFETMRAYGDHVFRLDAHLTRAAAGADRLGFAPPTRDEMAAAVRSVVAATRRALDDPDDLVVRMTLTPGPLDPAADWPLRSLGRPTMVVTTHRLVLDPAIHGAGITAVCVPWVRTHPEVKTVSYLASTLARRRAAAAGADEALLTDDDGTVAEGAGSNVFAVVDGHLVTPDAGVLPGVTRDVVLDVAEAVGHPVVRRDLTRDELLGASEAFVTASTREVVPLVRVDDQPIGDGSPGSVTTAVLAAYRAEVERERHA